MMALLEIYLKTIGGLLRANRKLKDKTLFDIAEKSGVNIRILRAIEESGVDIRFSTFYKISMACGIDPTIEVSRLIIETSLLIKSEN